MSQVHADGQGEDYTPPKDLGDPRNPKAIEWNGPVKGLGNVKARPEAKARVGCEKKKHGLSGTLFSACARLSLA